LNSAAIQTAAMKTNSRISAAGFFGSRMYQKETAPASSEIQPRAGPRNVPKASVARQ
jgi:hypothetical protein